MKLLFDNLIQSWEPQKLFIFEEMGFEQSSFSSPVETAEPVENKAQKTLTYNPEQSREIRQQIYKKEQQEQHEFESNKNRISETLIKKALEDQNYYDLLNPEERTPALEDKIIHQFLEEEKALEREKGEDVMVFNF